MPTDCPGKPSLFERPRRQLGEPAPRRRLRPLLRTEYESADLTGKATRVARRLRGAGLQTDDRSPAPPPTSPTPPRALTSPLHSPRTATYERAQPRRLKDATITFPAGMTVNPSQAAGLRGLLGGPGRLLHRQRGGALLLRSPPELPDASKLGTIEVTSPLLVARNEATRSQARRRQPGARSPARLDLPGPALPKPLRLAGRRLPGDRRRADRRSSPSSPAKARLDPATGQITTPSPKAPSCRSKTIEVHLFGGARGALITPPDLRQVHHRTPSSPPGAAPEGQPTPQTSAFEVRAAAGGGPCPRPSPAPTPPSFAAGTRTPRRRQIQPAAASSVSREDGTQRLAGIEADPARGPHRQAGRGRAAAPRPRSPGHARAKSPKQAPPSSPTPAARPHSQSAASSPPPAPGRPPSTPPGTPTSPAPTRAPRSASWSSSPPWPGPLTSARWSVA